MPEIIVCPDSPFVYSIEAKSKYAIAFLPYYEDTLDDTCNFDDRSEIDELRVHEYNTWDTWRMIPKSAPVITPPQVVTKFSDLKAKDGQLDETVALHPTTLILYRQMCSGKFEFYLDRTYLDKFDDFYIFYTHLLESLHGKKKIIVLSDEPAYMYFGRLFIEEVQDDGNGDLISISMAYNIEPYIYQTNGLGRYYLNGKSAIEISPYQKNM